MTKAVAALATVDDLLQSAELEGIEVYELRAKGVERENAQDFEETYRIQAGVLLEPGLLKNRFSLTFDAKVGEYFIDLAIRYRLAEDTGPLGASVTIEFTERIGIMAAYPFIREQLYSMASRLGHPVPVLGLIRQGQFTLTPDEPPTDGV